MADILSPNPEARKQYRRDRFATLLNSYVQEKGQSDIIWGIVGHWIKESRLPDEQVGSLLKELNWEKVKTPDGKVIIRHIQPENDQADVRLNRPNIEVPFKSPTIIPGPRRHKDYSSMKPDSDRNYPGTDDGRHDADNV